MHTFVDVGGDRKGEEGDDGHNGAHEYVPARGLGRGGLGLGGWGLGVQGWGFRVGDCN